MQELTTAESAKLDQFEQALGILAAVVSRLTKEARLTKKARLTNEARLSNRSALITQHTNADELSQILADMKARVDIIEIRQSTKPSQELLESIHASLARVMKIRKARAS